MSLPTSVNRSKNPIEMKLDAESFDHMQYKVKIPPRYWLFGFFTYPFWGFFGNVKILVVDEGFIITGYKMAKNTLFFFLTFLLGFAIFHMLLWKVIPIVWVGILGIAGMHGVNTLRVTLGEITLPFTSFSYVKASIDLDDRVKPQVDVCVSMRWKKVRQKFIFPDVEQAESFMALVQKKSIKHTAKARSPFTYSVIVVCSILFWLSSNANEVDSPLSWAICNWFSGHNYFRWSDILWIEPWTLFSTAFIHENWPAFLTSIIAFYFVARRIEISKGRVFLFWHMLLFAVVANVVSLIIYDLNFGGMLGATCGLLAYSWMQKKQLRTHKYLVFYFAIAIWNSIPLLLFLFFQRECKLFTTVDFGVLYSYVSRPFDLSLGTWMHSGLVASFLGGLVRYFWKENRKYFYTAILLLLFYVVAFSVGIKHFRLYLLFCFMYIVEMILLFYLCRSEKTPQVRKTTNTTQSANICNGYNQ
ncbi:rhomboid family intramembrane serine protease [Candidatus Uabimicrobium amorphum]|uniref:Peptidase S54 rhomboid domain-containing protein n=1 Tax=Uabimicrobium amorphum TaxID=2596890 RepID=A0A5S9ISF1_UABAM|nr:rhomboid family intramembrane serine protease [Candidatus Uabimicrobium amorphum]BBM86300.1 hypothetical protein UABAM_04686 [Candidatus Uabimicrobium amorphum]